MATHEKDEVYLFLDDSNLWLEGQKLKQGAGKQDPRFRIDLGGLCSFVTRTDDPAHHDHLQQAYLFGSRPPQNDGVWRAAKKNNFILEIFPKKHGREKQVDTALSARVVEEAMRLHFDSTIAGKLARSVFVIISGDADMLPPIQTAIRRGVRVRVLAFDSSLSTELRQYEHVNYSVRCIDDDVDSFSFTAFMSTMRLPADKGGDFDLCFRRRRHNENLEKQ